MRTAPVAQKESSEEETTAEQKAYSKEDRFTFDPQQDLNLPGSYDEVVLRFKNLQGDRAMKTLN